MTHLTEQITALYSALMIVALTWTPLINVPAAQASTLLALPTLA